jgi:hypothetical protein
MYCGEYFLFVHYQNSKNMKPLPYNEELVADVNYSQYKGMYFTSGDYTIFTCEQIIIYVDGGISVKDDCGRIHQFDEVRWIKKIV